MTKEQLSKRIGELYKLEATTGWHDIVGDLWLLDDTARMFELAVEHDIWIHPYNNLGFVRVNKRTGVDSFEQKYSEHPTKLEATIYAIGLALVRKAEMK